MNRNSEHNFSINPTNLEIKRSTFMRNSGLKTTFNAGQLIPIYIDEVLPGDTFSMTQANIIRMSTPIYPVMDNAFIDTYYFFVPNRLLWNHWKEFNGENTEGHWTQKTEYQIPQIKPPLIEGWEKGTIADYMGIPTKTEAFTSINHLPFRAYCMIWNEWFRDQNLQDPCYINKDETTLLGENIPEPEEGPIITESQYITNAQLGGEPLPVNKFHDYFTSALPEPQKGEPVTIPFGDFAEVITKDQTNNLDNDQPIQWRKTDDTIPEGKKYIGVNGENFEKGYGIVGTDFTEGTPYGNIKPANLWAKMGEQIAPTINELRQAFQIQKLLERDARGGTRYTETIKNHFGVTSPDSRLQRPEYLGGDRIPVGMDQVIQTSSTDETSPQGNTAAYSLSGNSNHMFTKSFTEHGYIIGLCCVRTKHTYQQGVERMWNRKNRFDFYWPALANIGEQAILNKEIYAYDPMGGNAKMEEAFGYQEAWAEYRYKPSRVSGAMRSNYEQSLDIWHYADYYKSEGLKSNIPALSHSWIKETKNNIDRTIAIQSELEDQFIADFAFNCKTTRPMPLYSIPGLMDHN